MMGSKDYQEKLFYGFSLTRRVPEGHLVKELDRVIDLSFVRPLVRKYYSHTGQPSVDPVVLFKMMIMGYLYGITSERRLAEECSLNMAFMWYLGYDLDEPTPNHSVISRARTRYGKEVFEKFFQEILYMCVKAGLVKGEKLFADSTLIKANASLRSIVPRAEARELKYTPKEYVEKVFRENPVEEEEGSRAEEKKKAKVSNQTHTSSTDPEAGIVARPREGLMIAYKGHFTVDSSRVVTALEVSPAQVEDSVMVERMIEAQPVKPEEFCADSHYGVPEVYEGLLKRGIKPVIPRRSPQTRRPRAGKIPIEAFKYESGRDVFICPEGKELKRVAYERRWRRYHYRARLKDCKGCGRRSECTGDKSARTMLRYSEGKQEAVDWAVNYLGTPGAQKTLSQRPIFAEWLIAEAKTLHGLRRAFCRGVEKVGIQALLTASVQNIKRLLRHYRDKMDQVAIDIHITEKIQSSFKFLASVFTAYVRIKSVSLSQRL